MDETQNDPERRRRRAALVLGVAGGTCLAFGGWGVARDGAPALRDLAPGLPDVTGLGSDGGVASARAGSSPAATAPDPAVAPGGTPAVVRAPAAAPGVAAVQGERPGGGRPGGAGQDVAGVQVSAGGVLAVDGGRDGSPAVVTLHNARPGDTARGTLRIRNRAASRMDLGLRVVSVDDTPGPLGGLLSRSLRLDLREPGASRAVVRASPVALRRSRSLGSLQARGTLRLDLELTFLDGGTPSSPTAGDNVLQGSAARVVLEITGRT